MIFKEDNFLDHFLIIFKEDHLLDHFVGSFEKFSMKIIFGSLFLIQWIKKNQIFDPDPKKNIFLDQDHWIMMIWIKPRKKNDP